MANCLVLKQQELDLGVNFAGNKVHHAEGSVTSTKICDVMEYYIYP